MRAYSQRRFVIDPRLESIVKNLTRNGIATASDSEVFEGQSLVDELVSQVAIDQGRVQGRGSSGETLAADKPYMTFLLGQSPCWDPASVYARFAIQQPLLDIADAYFGMVTKVRYYNVWLNQASEAAPTASQLWHRDREDRMILKVFVYLNEVAHENGPFVYAPGTHLLGKNRVEPEYSMESSVARSTDEQMNKVVPEDRWVQCLGQSGTLVFADTHGFHRGGLVKQGNRILYTCMFTSPACQRNYFQYPTGARPSSSAEERFF